MIMKMTEIRKFKTDELATETTRLREEIAELRRRATLGELDNVRLVRAKRKDLARMLTVLGEQLTKENI